MRKYIVEFIGTFFLVFTIGMMVIVGDAGEVSILAPFAIAGALMVMIYAGGHISGGHFNPAVTLAVLMRGKCSPVDAVPYIVSQCLGAFVAALAVTFLKGELMPAEAAPAITAANMPAVILVEALFTFALAFVVLNVATAKGTEGNSFYGLAIGSVVLVGALSVGGISGGVFNPAVAVGIGLMKLANWATIWVYFAANFGGGALAAIIFRIVNGSEAE